MAKRASAILVLSAYALLATSCGTANFGSESGSGLRSHTVSTDSSTTTAAHANSGVTPSKSGDDENTAARQPVQVSGAFLVCTRDTEIYCVLKDAADKKFNFPTQVETTVKVELFSSSEVKAAFFEWQDNASTWHWKLQANGFVIADVQKLNVHIVGQADRQADFVATFIQHPMQIGDGSDVQGGCTWAASSAAEAGGLVYNKDITLAGDQTKMLVTVNKLCGIVRANDSIIRLVRAGATVKEYFLPVTNVIGDYSYSFDGLSAGTYTLTMIPGDDIDIDDFMFYGLTISF